MPRLKPNMPVEGYKLTREQKAFMKTFDKVRSVSEALKRGIQFQTSKLQALQQTAQQVEGMKQELLLRAPDQSTLEAEDEGMVQ